MSRRNLLNVRCPRCGGQATFRKPFAFFNQPVAGTPTRRWGGWHVLERYPHLLPWQAPKGSSSQYLTTGVGDSQGYPLMQRGVIECGAGCEPVVHVLTWPEDAWWQWSIRGRMLWAWDREHAGQILDYVRATDRPPRSTYGPLGSLPSHFLSAKVREAVVKAISRTLAGS